VPLSFEQRQRIRQARDVARRDAILAVADRTAAYYREVGIKRVPMDVLRLRPRESASQRLASAQETRSGVGTG